jgi:hypothetical protein
VAAAAAAAVVAEFMRTGRQKRISFYFTSPERTRKPNEQKKRHQKAGKRATKK